MSDENPKISSDLAKASVVLVITVNVSLSFLTSLFLVAINLSISFCGGHVIISFIASKAACGSVSAFSNNFFTSLIPYAAIKLNTKGITIAFNSSILTFNFFWMVKSTVTSLVA